MKSQRPDLETLGVSEPHEIRCRGHRTSRDAQSEIFQVPKAPFDQSLPNTSEESDTSASKGTN